MWKMFCGATSFCGDISSWNIHPNCITTDMLKGTLLDYYQQRRDDTLKSTEAIKEELVAKAWHPSRLVWCLDDDLF
jgi:hypothetical protein